MPHPSEPEILGHSLGDLQATTNPKIQMIQGRGFGAYHDFSGLWTRIGVLRQQLDRFEQVRPDAQSLPLA